MKYLFMIFLLGLCGASYFTWKNLPETTSELPVIYWVTDANPARAEQVRLFGEWLKKCHYPPIELKLDMANADLTKKIIQGVSGVAGDVMDMYAAGSDMRYFRAMGLNADVTDAAKALGFDLAKTYPALQSDLAMEDPQGRVRQYQFPCNVTAPLYFVNRETFRQHHQPLPPARWTIQEFESRGREFVEAANAGRRQRTAFFADSVPIDVLRASLGGCRFNETATRCTLDQEPAIEAWAITYRWTFVDRLVPTNSDRSSFTVDSGYGGLSAQLFNNQDAARGQYAMLWTGRYLIIEFRKYDALRKAQGKPLMDLGCAEPPNGGFPNTVIAARAATVYAGGIHQDLAKYFLGFLASEEYNMQIVQDGDSLPPNPKYTEIEAYKHPPEHPNEWDIHKAFADAAGQLAVGTAYSPFILQSTADRLENNSRDKFMQEKPAAGYETARKAALYATVAINDEMQLTLRENPRLQPLYEKLRVVQAQTS